MAGGITFVFAYGRTDVAFSSVSSEVNLSGSQADPRSLGARATATFAALCLVRSLLGRSNIHRCVQCSEPDAYRRTAARWAFRAKDAEIQPRRLSMKRSRTCLQQWRGLTGQSPR